MRFVIMSYAMGPTDDLKSVLMQGDTVTVVNYDRIPWRAAKNIKAQEQLAEPHPVLDQLQGGAGEIIWVASADDVRGHCRYGIDRPARGRSVARQDERGG